VGLASVVIEERAMTRRMLPEDEELGITYYSALMNTQEHEAHHHLLRTMKATKGRSGAAAQQEAKGDHVPGPHLSVDPVVLDLAAGGLRAFAARTGKRILAERASEVFLNCCPKCAKLALTPKARQCRFCHHDWHTE